MEDNAGYNWEPTLNSSEDDEQPSLLDYDLEKISEEIEESLEKESYEDDEILSSGIPDYLIDTKGYLNNPNLPQAGARINWTKELVEEYQKCYEDPVYFAEKYCKIVTIDDGLISIPLYDFQKEIIRAYPTNLKLLLNQSRQSGKTTVVTIIILHFALFNKNKRIVMLANKGAQAIEIMSRVQLMYEYLPPFLKGGIKEWNKGSFQLANGTILVAAASSSTAIRGKAVGMLYLDEMAFIPNWDEFAASVLPTLSSGKTARMFISSTPNGLNQFYEYCQGAIKKTNGFWYIEVPWHMVPGRDEDWKKKTLEDMNHDIEKFRAEYELEFLGSSGTLISGWKLKELTGLTPILSRDDIYQYEQYIEGNEYALIADVSRGKGLDFSAFHVINISKMPYKQVLVYRSNLITPIDYSSIIFRIAKAYHNPIVLVEINDIGGQVADSLYEDFEYDNLISTENGGRTGKRVAISSSKNDKGIRTTKSVKAIGCSILKLLVEGNQLEIVDFETIRELSKFSKKGNSYEAESGSHDDLVMGLVLFSWLTDQPYFSDLTNINTMNNLREKSEEEFNSDYVPFGYIDNGIDEDYHTDFWDISDSDLGHSNLDNNVSEYWKELDSLLSHKHKMFDNDD
jgi:hypothetical protein